MLQTGSDPVPEHLGKRYHHGDTAVPAQDSSVGSRSAHCGVSGEAGLQGQRLAAEVEVDCAQGSQPGRKAQSERGCDPEKCSPSQPLGDEDKLGVCWRDKGLREMLERVLSQEEERPAGAQE